MAGSDHARKKAVRERMSITGESYTAALRALAEADVTVDELTAEVTRLAREMVHGIPVALFPQLFQTRDRIYRVMERRQHPRHTGQLRYLASIMCSLLADLSAGFGRTDTALEYGRAGGAYAEIIGHNVLRLRARMLQAGITSQQGDHQRAYDLVVSSTQWATGRLNRFGFNSVKAYYSTLAGNNENAGYLLDEFVDHYDPDVKDDLAEIGGVFKRKRAKMFQDVSDTYLLIGDIGKAEASSSQAVRLYENSRTEDRAYGSETLARITLASARLARKETDGTLAALKPVFALPPQQRLAPIPVRLSNLLKNLAGCGAGKSATEIEIHESIREFIRTSHYPSSTEA